MYLGGWYRGWGPSASPPPTKSTRGATLLLKRVSRENEFEEKVPLLLFLTLKSTALFCSILVGGGVVLFCLLVCVTNTARIEKF